MFQNIPESMQNVPQCMQNVPECSRMYAESFRMYAECYRICVVNELGQMTSYFASKFIVNSLQNDKYKDWNSTSSIA